VYMCVCACVCCVCLYVLGRALLAAASDGFSCRPRMSISPAEATKS